MAGTGEVFIVRGELKIGFLLALAVLILMGLLGMAIGTVLAVLLLLTAGTISVVNSCVLSVRRCTVLIICSRQHGAIIRVVVGPTVAFINPLMEVVGAILDTDYRMEQVYAGAVLLRDQYPTTCGLAVRVFYQLAPELLSSAELEKLLPILTESASDLVSRDTEYCLRKLAATVDRSSIHISGRDRLERCLQGVLADRLARQGIQIQSLQLLVHSPTGLQETLNRAEQQRLISDTQADSLATALNTLSGKSDEARSLADLEFARALGRNGQPIIAINRYSHRDAAWVDCGELMLSDHE